MVVHIVLLIGVLLMGGCKNNTPESDPIYCNQDSDCPTGLRCVYRSSLAGQGSCRPPEDYPPVEEPPDPSPEPDEDLETGREKRP